MAPALTTLIVIYKRSKPHTMTNLRFQVVEEAFKKKPLEVIAPVERPSEYFGKYVFNRAKMYNRPLDSRRRGRRHEAVGRGERRDPLHALVPAADRGHRREARRLHRARRQGRHDRGVLWQAARTAGARRQLVPQRRNTQHVRGARILGMGPHVARVHHGRHALHTYDIHLIHRRGARLQGPAAARPARSERGRHRRLPLLRPESQEPAT